jgi:RHS repeat-associated protein
VDSISGSGGQLDATVDQGGTVTVDLRDLHGDVSATASGSATATSLSTTNDWTEFGSPNSGAAGRFGWLGAQLRTSQLAGSVVTMGKRVYLPSAGRFLQTDPVPGGSANAYDYVNQDPVDGFDLSGEYVSINPGGGGSDAWVQCRIYNHYSPRGGLRSRSWNCSVKPSQSSAPRPLKACLKTGAAIAGAGVFWGGLSGFLGGPFSALSVPSSALVGGMSGGVTGCVGGALYSIL